jgi:hypothetical protein
MSDDTRDWCDQLARACPLVDNFVSTTLASGIGPDALLRPMLSAAIRLSAMGECLGPDGDLMERQEILDWVAELLDGKTGKEAANERDHIRYGLIELLMCGLREH